MARCKKNKRFNVLNLPKQRQVCPFLFFQFDMRISVIYGTLSVSRERVVQACRERGFTFSTKFLWRVTNVSMQNWTRLTVTCKPFHLGYTSQNLILSDLFCKLYFFVLFWRKDPGSLMTYLTFPSMNNHNFAVCTNCPLRVR